MPHKTKTAFNEYRRRTYPQSSRREYNRVYQAKRNQKHRDWYCKIKEQYQCQNPSCPVKGPLPGLALDFHHLDPAVKDKAISRLTGSLNKIKSEIKKCTVLCALCHRLETHGLLDASSFPKCTV